MSNVLDDEQQHRILTLGRLGWTLRRIEAATGVRRETASGYLAELGVGLERLGQDLDRDGAIKPRVARAIDLSHAAGAKRRYDFVRAETRAGG